MSELRAFLAMLSRIGIGYGIRYEHNPTGTAVQVEHPHGTGFYVSEWSFDAEGNLTHVSHFTGEEG